ncbi:FtsX-like permease family protein [Clostridium estertheticum]|uniref:ABC transporter permease n=1 Tax=Clostridium estertheticum TaxID=238834 RepID=UPI001CF5D995|nr:FtsX-like permease family protein [Clostridium estertheticum]MCB2305691.1 FtsX-like permease family protein [Clostridium estertheticum]MCB2344494.1 FtsX-like permease family protein [Clostridium estertheticum]MCB2348046.1 FtsX-like permease family protein [Clostridium estertheticum]WAG45688.1 FtsX-like permease family protein [Clostridium estertheticum]
MVINKKIKRTMMENKSQYFGSLALIVISCLLFTMFNLLSGNLANITSSFGKNYKQEDSSFMSDKKLSNISEIESKFNMKMEEGNTFDYPVTKDKVIRIFSQNTKVNIPAIIKGKALSGNDILIDPAYAKANKLEVGDSFKVYDKSFKIAGFMSLPSYIYPLKEASDILTDPNNFGIAVMTKVDLSVMKKGNVFYSIRFNGDRRDVEKRTTAFKDYLNNEDITIISWMDAWVNSRITFVTTKISGINQISSSMPVAILLLTCILTGIVMWRMIKREAVIIGTLYAFGYKKKQIQNHYLRYPIIIALTGGIIGTILGVLALKPMINVMVSYFNMPVGTVNFDIKYLLISILMPVVFLSAAGYLVVNKSLKSSPLELMRGGKENNKVGFIEKNLKLDKLRFSTKFKVREQLRSIPRSVFLLLGVSLATVLLLFVFAAKSSLESLMKDGFDASFKYNYSYVFNSIKKGNPKDGEAFSESPFTLKSDSKINIVAYGVSPSSKYVVFKDKSGKILSTDKSIITSSLADKLKVNPGDTIKVINTLDSKLYSITVDSIAKSYVGNYIYIPMPKFNKMMSYPSGSYMGLWSNSKLNIPENQLLTTVTKADIKNAFNAMTAPIQTMVGTMAFMSFLIGLIVIYVVTSMIIDENKENISLMKVLGYRKKEVYSMILNSSAFLVILGYILGVPILLALLGAMFKSLTKEMSLSLPVTISYSYLIIGFVIIYITYELSKALSKKKLNKISMTEVLKSRLE